MSDIVAQHNIESLLQPVNALDAQTINAPSSTGAAFKVGNAIDRFAQLPANYLSADLQVHYKATLAAHKKAQIIAKMEDALSTAAFAAYGNQSSAVIIGSTGATAAQTLRGVASFPFDLGSARRYIRFDVQPALSATSADSIAVAGVAALGGADRLS